MHHWSKSTATKRKHHWPDCSRATTRRSRALIVWLSSWIVSSSWTILVDPGSSACGSAARGCAGRCAAGGCAGGWGCAAASAHGFSAHTVTNSSWEIVLTSASLETPKKKYILFFHFHRGAIAPRTPHPAHLGNIQPGEKILYGSYDPLFPG